MREQPWHLRRSSNDHELWYQNLVDLHDMTLGWLKDLSAQSGQSKMERAPADQLKITEDLPWVINALTETGALAERGLENILDDTLPEDLLGRLQQNILQGQVWALHAVFEKTPENQKAEVTALLEQSSWRAGRDSALKRWPKFGLLDDSRKNDLRAIYQAFHFGPLSGFPLTKNILLRRSILQETQLEWLQCPHQSTEPEVLSVAQELCRLQTAWCRGFTYSLNTRVQIEYTPRDSKHARCSQRWTWVQ